MPLITANCNYYSKYILGFFFSLVVSEEFEFVTWIIHGSSDETSWIHHGDLTDGLSVNGNIEIRPGENRIKKNNGFGVWGSIGPFLTTDAKKGKPKNSAHICLFRTH